GGGPSCACQNPPITTAHTGRTRGDCGVSDAIQKTGLLLPVELGALTPIIDRAVEAAIARLEQRLAAAEEGDILTEEQAARLLQVESHVLRDERRRGRISASRIVGRRIRYQRRDLVAYLDANRLSHS